MSDGVETILIEDDEDDRDFPFSMIPVWINYSGLSNAAYRLYATLRSVSIEGDAKGTRKLLDSDLCELIGRAQGKPITTRTLERWRDELVEHGLLKIDKAPLDRPGVGRPQMTRRYRLVKYPRQGQEVVRSAWTLLKEIQDRREKPHPLPPAEISPTKMSENSEEGGFPTKMSECSTKMSENCGADLRRRGSKNPLREEPSSSSPHPSTRLAARKGRGARRRKEDDKIIKDFSHTHLDLVKPLVLELPGGVDAAQADEITRLVCAALDRGWAPSAVFARLREKCDLEKSRNPGAVHLYNARLLGEPSRAQAAKAAVELCRVCDEDGFTSDTSACSADPEAVPDVCLHGAADPWDDPEYRAERERERSEALYARQKAEEEARHRKSRTEAAKRREAARRAADTERRRQAATRFLESEPPIGDETADTVRRIFLTADDPADLADLETLVSMGIDLVESGSSVLELVNITVTVPREKWLTAILDRFDPVPADA